MIKVNDLHHSFAIGKKDAKKEVSVLKGINFSIEKGEIVSIVGRSGSGKSTLLQIIAGFMTPSSGSVLINNIQTTQFSEKEHANFRLNHFGFIFQNFQLLPGQNVFENIELPLTLLGISKKERIIRVNEILDTVGLREFSKHYPNELSGGQQQRVSIARALITNPSIILADEPTGSLDSKTEREILDFIIKLNKEKGITFIIVTHDDEVSQIASHILKMSDGLLAEEGVKS